MKARTRGKTAPMDPMDPRRADKWGYTDEEIRGIIPGLEPIPEEEDRDASPEPRQGRA